MSRRSEPATGIGTGARTDSRADSPVRAGLDNGLTVLVQTMAYSEAAAATLAYDVGSVRETDGTRGLSHFCEHMLFKGTGRNGPGAYWRAVQSAGGTANAYTSRDLTVYYALLPAAGLRGLLELEADRMTGCSMDPASVARERGVILEERITADRDSPSGVIEEALFSGAFPVHPYGRPVIGSARDIEAFATEGVSAFYGRFYRPSNAVLSLIVPCEADRALDLAREVFGGLPSLPRDLVEPPPEAPQNGTVRLQVTHPSPLRRLAMGFRVPGADHPDSAALSLLAIHLAAGRSCRFEEMLVAPGTVLDISAGTNPYARPGLFTIQAVLPAGTPFEAVEQAVKEELERISREGVPEERLRSLKERQRAWSLIQDTEPSGRSRRHATGLTLYGDPLFYLGTVEAAEALDREAMADAIARCFDDGRLTVVRLEPESGGTAVGVPAAAPRRAAERDLEPPLVLLPEQASVAESLLVPSSKSVADASESFRLSNGMRVVLRPDRSFPTVSLAFSFPMGTSMEPVGREGLAEVACETMLYGTPEEDSVRFHERMESIGSSMELETMHEFAYGWATVLREDLATAVSSASDLLRRPAFRGRDVDAVLRETLAGIADWSTTPVGAAMDAFSRLSTTPAGAAGVPTAESVGSLSRDDLAAFHDANCRPEGTVLVLVGDFDPGTARRMVEDGFGPWTAPTARPAVPREAGNSGVSGSATVRLEGREQIAVIMGTPAPPRTHSDAHAFDLLNGILGEGIGSRLGRRIRDDEGLAYHVSSAYLPFRERGRLAVLLLTSPPAFGRATDLLREEIDRIRSGKVTEEELRLEKAWTLGSHLLAGTQYGTVARMLMTHAALDLPLDYDRISLGRIAALTGDDLAAAAGRWLSDGRLYAATAGAVP